MSKFFNDKCRVDIWKSQQLALHISSTFRADWFAWFIDFVWEWMKICFGLAIRWKDLKFLWQLFNIYFAETLYLLLVLLSYLHELSSVYSLTVFSFFSCSPHIFLLVLAHNRIWVWDRGAVGFEIKESWIPVHLWWGTYCYDVVFQAPDACSCTNA